MRQAIALYLFYWRGSGNIGNVSMSLKIAKLGMVRVGIWTETVWLQNLCCPAPHAFSIVMKEGRANQEKHVQWSQVDSSPDLRRGKKKQALNK